MHRAPVVGIVVLDGHGVPLPEPLEVAHDLARSPDMQGLHHLLVISEEQFKVTHPFIQTHKKKYKKTTAAVRIFICFWWLEMWGINHL